MESELEEEKCRRKWKQRARVKTEEGNKRREERQPRRKASLDL